MCKVKYYWIIEILLSPSHRNTNLPEKYYWIRNTIGLDVQKENKYRETLNFKICMKMNTDRLHLMQVLYNKITCHPLDSNVTDKCFVIVINVKENMNDNKL